MAAAAAAVVVVGDTALHCVRLMHSQSMVELDSAGKRSANVQMYEYV